MRRFLSGLGISSKILIQKARALVGMSHAEVERTCIDILKECVLEGKKTCQEKDIDRAVKRQKDRIRILKYVSSDAHPKVDIE